MIRFTGYDKFVWFFGVVEDRMDPIKMGRVRIRIFGYHTEDDSFLKTEELPWAFPIMPCNSASYSDVGISPTGLVTGSLVFGFFVDGEECQVPAILGSIPSYPLENLEDPKDEKAKESDDISESIPNPQVASNNPVNANHPPLSGCGGSGEETPPQTEAKPYAQAPVKAKPTPPPATKAASGADAPKPTKEKPNIKVTTTSAQTSIAAPVDKDDMDRSIVGEHKVGNMSPEETKAMMHKMKQRESSGNYQAENRLGYIGGYQFGGAALADAGYVDKTRCTSNSCLNDPSVWTGKGGISSKEDFLNNPAEQDKAMEMNMQRNYNQLNKNGTISSDDSSERVAGLLSVSHLLGAGGARKFANGNDSSDANGTTGSQYYALGSNSVKNLG
jgi:hypothetical protein